LNQFKWVPFFEEFSKKLLDYKERQSELLTILRKTGKEIENIISKIDNERGKAISIDPFTLFSIFLAEYGSKAHRDKRVLFLEVIKKEFNLASDIPNSFSGLSRIAHFRVWLSDITSTPLTLKNKILWELFEQAHQDKIDDKLFNELIKLDNIGLRTITAALHWVLPSKFLPTSQTLKNYLKTNNISGIIKDYKGYFSILQQVKEKVNKPFYQITYEAHLRTQSKKQSNNSKEYAVEFFTEEDFTILKDFAGTKKEDINAINFLKKTYRKVEYWVELLKHEFGTNWHFRCRKYPLNQAGYFESYHWAKLYPNKETLHFKILAYTVSVNSESLFTIKIDTVGLGPEGSADQNRKLYEGYRGNFEDSNIIRRISKDELLNKGWENLISVSKEVIEDLEDDYNILLNKLGFRDNSMENDVPKNLILYGPPGTGKTYHTISYAVAIIENKDVEIIKSAENEERVIIKEKFNQYSKEGRIRFVTFHQNYSYEDFIQGIKPDVSNSDGDISFTLKDGIFKEIVDKAKQPKESNFEAVYKKFCDNQEEQEQELELQTPIRNRPFKVTLNSNKNCKIRPMKETASIMVITKTDIQNYLFEGKIRDWKPYLVPLSEHIANTYNFIRGNDQKENYVLIIDEINRANISRVFGELITLLEPDKRIGEDNELMVTLPSGESDFGVPSNLYIIGTMNTADRSIALIDIALRRRFSFEPMYPDYSRVPDIVRSFFIRLNELIKNKKDEDFMIGHSYFMNVKDEESFGKTINEKVIPLLYDYFYNKKNEVKDLIIEALKDSNLNCEIDSAETEKYGRIKLREITE